MKISANENNFIRDNIRTLMPLYWVLRIVGLESNKTSPKLSKPYWAIIKNVLRASILAAIDYYTLNYKVTYLYDTQSLSPSIKYTDTIQTVYDFTQYIVDLYYVRKYGTELSFEYFKQYETIDMILGVVNYSKIRNKLLRLIGIFGVIWISSTVCDFTAWVLNFGWQDSAVYSVAYIFLLIKILTTLDLTSQIMHIECRLRALGDWMQTYCNATECSSPLLKNNVCKKKWLDYNTADGAIETPSDTARRVPCNEYHNVKWLSRCYLLLTEQTTFVNKMYGIRILLNSLSLLIDMVRFTNVAVRIIMGSQRINSSYEYFPVITSIMRLLTCAAILISLMWHCEQVYRQRDRILDIIDHLLVFKNPSEDLKTKAGELRNLIQARPLEFNMANFFRLDCSLLVSIASVVVTYSIIILQNVN